MCKFGLGTVRSEIVKPLEYFMDTETCIYQYVLPHAALKINQGKWTISSMLIPELTHPDVYIN